MTDIPDYDWIAHHAGRRARLAIHDLQTDRKFRPGETLEEGDVIRHCLGNLAKFKVPQSVAVVDALPRNATGKVLKRERRRQAGDHVTGKVLAALGMTAIGSSTYPVIPSVARDLSSSNQRHVVVFADALQDQEGERGLARIGHQMRPAGRCT